VEIRYGPAAVNGDETRRGHCAANFYEAVWEGAGSRLIRESEDLPTCLNTQLEMMAKSPG